MSLIVACPGCPTKLSAPESALGKQIRCPKCKTIVTVPALIAAEEVPVVDAAVARPKPKPVVVAAAAEDEDGPPRKRSRHDDDDDEDEPPRKKKRRTYDDEPPRRRRRKPSKGGGGLVVVIVVGVLLLVGAVGAGLYFLTGKGGMFASKAPVPPGWQQFSYPQSGFKAAFPSEPTVFGAKMQHGPAPAPLPGGIEIPQIESMYSYTTNGTFGGRSNNVSVTVEVHRYSTPIPRASLDLMSRNGTGQFTGPDLKRIRWLGGSALEVTVGNTLMRMLVVDKTIIVAQISGPDGARAKPEEEAGFFDSFELAN